MFIGFAGLAYHAGIVTALVATVGLMLGDHLGWNLAGDKIRSLAHKKKIRTYPTLVGAFNKNKQTWVIRLTAILTILFLGAYCAAQLVAGSKVAASLFDIDYNVFVLLGSIVLLVYCWAGGIRASIWTDVVQSIIIICAIALLIVVGVHQLGGVTATYQAIAAVDASIQNPFTYKQIFNFIGWFGFGVGVLGQPQLMIRHMTARGKKDIYQAKKIYLSWRWTVLTLACLTGVLARVILPFDAGFDPELSMPILWQELLPPVLVGFLLAGLFSATMSTADSLLLAASSALTQHIMPHWRNSYFLAKMGTVLITLFIVAIALFANKGVLALVIFAWGGLAAAITPLMVMQLLGRRIPEEISIAMMIAGFMTALIWRYGFGWNHIVMDLVPGICVGFMVYAAAVRAGKIKLANTGRKR